MSSFRTVGWARFLSAALLLTAAMPGSAVASTSASSTGDSSTGAATSTAVTSSAAVGAAATSRASDGLEVSAWLPYWNVSTATAAAERIPALTTVSLFWYDASCTRVSSQAPAGWRQVVSRLRAKKLTVIPTITASGLAPEVAAACFSSSTSRTALARRLVDLATSNRFDGVDLDFEHLALTTKSSTATSVRIGYSAFVRQLCDRLRAVSKTCVVTVMPRTSDSQAVWQDRLIPAVYDYRSLSAAADRIRVMAYDEHNRRTAAGSIAGLPWVEQVAAYVAATAPAHKVELGLPAYGRDWAAGAPVRTLTLPAAAALAKKHRAQVVLDPVQKEARFTYRVGRVRHTVWFASAAGLPDRLTLARRHGFAGVAVWALGMEDGAYRAALR